MPTFKIYYDYYLQEHCICLYLNGNFGVILDSLGERHMVDGLHVKRQLRKNRKTWL